MYVDLVHWLREALAGKSPAFKPEEIEKASGYMCGTMGDNLAAVAEGPMHRRYHDLLKVVTILRVAISFSEELDCELLESTDGANSHRLIDHLLVSNILLPRFEEFYRVIIAILEASGQALS